ARPRRVGDGAGGNADDVAAVLGDRDVEADGVGVDEGEAGRGAAVDREVGGLHRGGRDRRGEVQRDRLRRRRERGAVGRVGAGNGELGRSAGVAGGGED